MRGIFYRSDTRNPNAPDQIFTNGFSQRLPGVPLHLRQIAGPLNAPDVTPETAVCVTRDFLAAPLFPVGNLAVPSWVYVLDLDVGSMFNTQAMQYDYVSTNALNNGPNAGMALWPMFGQERAVYTVAAADIVGAVSVTRNFNGNNVFAGGTFTPTQYLANPNYGGQNAVLVQQTMTGFVNAGLPLNMPSRAQGIVANTPQVA